MRNKFWMLSASLGFGVLVLALVPGRSQPPGAVAPGRERSEPPPPSPVHVAATNPSTPSAWADERFALLDRDGDGYLGFDEMTETLRVEKDRWDANRDGQIDLHEWRDYVGAILTQQRRMASEPPSRPQEAARPFRPQFPQFPSRESRPQGATSRPPFVDPRQSKPKEAAARNSKLPSNLPPWFKDYDADNDGQIALHEWKAKNDPVREFKKYDLNRDSLITVEELVRSGQFATNTMPPPSVSGLRAEVGEFFYFEVTGAVRGFIWGTDVYTSDSALATAAVHAGVLRIGETGLVKVTILPGQDRYTGSVRNGVTTYDYGPFARSYSIELAPQAPR